MLICKICGIDVVESYYNRGTDEHGNLIEPIIINRDLCFSCTPSQPLNTSQMTLDEAIEKVLGRKEGEKNASNSPVPKE